MSVNRGVITIKLAKEYNFFAFEKMIKQFCGTEEYILINEESTTRVIHLDFDNEEWDDYNLNEKELLVNIKNQIISKEHIGFTLYSRVNIYDQLAVFSRNNKTINFFLSDGCKKILGTNLTDINNYLKTIIPICYSCFGCIQVDFTQDVDRNLKIIEK